MKNIYQKLIPALVMILFNLSAHSQPKVIAHRGYWDVAGSAQNSIASLRKAAEIGVWGCEFDVHVTRDGVPVVDHDGRIDGVKIEKKDFSELSHHRLSNGEPIPTLERYLEEGARHPEMKLILEIKSASSTQAETRAVEIIMKTVAASKAAAQVEYIAFSLHVVRELLKADPTLRVAYLEGDLSPARLAEYNIPGFDYSAGILMKNPEWISQARKAGIYTNVWTVNKEKDMRFMIEHGIDFITTDKPVELIKLLDKYR